MCYPKISWSSFCFDVDLAGIFQKKRRTIYKPETGSVGNIGIQKKCRMRGMPGLLTASHGSIFAKCQAGVSLEVVATI